MLWRVLCVVAITWLGLPVLAFARPGPQEGIRDLGSDPLFLLYDEGDLFISATETAHTLNDAPAIASVLTAKQIRDMGARTLIEALRALPGLDIQIFGPAESLVFRGLRRGEDDKVLVMLNGHRLNDSLIGTAFRTLSHFPLDAVERIEVIRGPGSALHGANAFVATINIILIDADGRDSSELRLGAGSDDTTQQGATLEHAGDAHRLLATYTHIGTNGAPQFISQDAAGNSGLTNDWREEHTGYARLRLDKTDLSAFVATQRRGTPVGLTGLVDTRTDRFDGQLFVRGIHTAEVGDARLAAEVSFDQDWHDHSWQLDTPLIGTGNSEWKVRTVAGQVKGYTLVEGRHGLTLGTEVRHVRQYDVKHIVDGVDVSATFNHNRNVTRRIIALFAQDEWAVDDRTTLTAGLRWDRYSDFGSSLNPRLAYVWTPNGDASVKVLYGRAFRAPSFLELYEQNNPVAVGNPNLKAETMDTVEVGLNWQFNGWGSLSGAAFANRFRNRIRRKLPLSINAGGADIHGVELELKGDWREMRYGYVNWSWNRGEDKATGLRLADVPHQRAKAGINWGLLNDRVNGNLGLRWAGKQSRPMGDTRPPTKAYTVVDLALTSPHRHTGVAWSFTVDNLLDKTVLDPSPPILPNGFPRPGRTWLFEVSYSY